MPVFVEGMVLSFGLIIAIGAQNAFVLRQGLRREHVGWIVLFCALADALLIAAGTIGLGQTVGENKTVMLGFALAGAIFLAVYGWNALRRASQSHALHPSNNDNRLTRGQALAQVAAFTLLNPHVYLDTLMLLGGIGAQQPAPMRGWFVAGASLASLIWFASLGFGARWLAPWFAKPKAWQILDGLIGVTMWAMAALLLRHAIKTV